MGHARVKRKESPMGSVPVRVEFLGETVQVFKKRKRSTFNGAKLPVCFAFNRVPTAVIGEVSPSGHRDPDRTLQPLVQLVDVGAEQVGGHKIQGRIGCIWLPRCQHTITPQGLVDVSRPPGALQKVSNNTGPGQGLENTLSPTVQGQQSVQPGQTQRTTGGSIAPFFSAESGGADQCEPPDGVRRFGFGTDSELAGKRYRQHIRDCTTVLRLDDGQRSMQSVRHQTRCVSAGTAFRKPKTRQFQCVDRAMLRVVVKQGGHLGCRGRSVHAVHQQQGWQPTRCPLRPSAVKADATCRRLDVPPQTGQGGRE